jgi:hypothetical protein
MLLKSQVLDQLQRVSSGALSVSAFKEWLSDASWDMHADGSSHETIDFVESIDWLFSEAEDASISKNGLRERLIKMQFNPAPAVVHSVIEVYSPKNSLSLSLIEGSWRVCAKSVNLISAFAGDSAHRNVKGILSPAVSRSVELQAAS